MTLPHLTTFTSAYAAPLMSRVCNVEDAKVEIDALRKERALLLRLRSLLESERHRLQHGKQPGVGYAAIGYPATR